MGLKSISEIEDISNARTVRRCRDGAQRSSGSLVGPATGAAASSLPMVRVEKISKLRLVVPSRKVFRGNERGDEGGTSASRFSDQTFTGTVARIAHSVDVKTRTMPVELDVQNGDGRLSWECFPKCCGGTAV